MNKQKVFAKILVIGLVFFLQACGNNSSTNSTTDTSTQTTTQTEESNLLTEENFVALAQYHFSRESIQLQKKKSVKEQNDLKFRSYPGAKTTAVASTKTLQITTTTPFNKYIESMQITAQNRTIKVEVTNNIQVTISLYDHGTLLKSVQQPLRQFQSFSLEGMGENS